jgi:hypothetical protein
MNRKNGIQPTCVNFGLGNSGSSAFASLNRDILLRKWDSDRKEEGHKKLLPYIDDLATYLFEIIEKNLNEHRPVFGKKYNELMDGLKTDKPGFIDFIFNHAYPVYDKKEYTLSSCIDMLDAQPLFDEIGTYTFDKEHRKILLPIENIQINAENWKSRKALEWDFRYVLSTKEKPADAYRQQREELGITNQARLLLRAYYQPETLVDVFADAAAGNKPLEFPLMEGVRNIEYKAHVALNQMCVYDLLRA